MRFFSRAPTIPSLKTLGSDPLPDFDKNDYGKSSYPYNSNLHLHNLFLGEDFLILGSGPSAKTITPDMVKNKKVISIGGANEIFKGHFYLSDSTPTGWNILKHTIQNDQLVLVPYTLYTKAFDEKLRSFRDLNFTWVYYKANNERTGDKWYQAPPPYSTKWQINSKCVPLNTGAQSATLAISFALIMGAKNISILGVDGFSNLMQNGKPVYASPVSEASYGGILNRLDANNLKDEQNTRANRDSADRYIVSQISNYCNKANVALSVLNQDSHLYPVVNEDRI